MSDEEILRSTNLYAKDISTGKKGLILVAILLFGKDEIILSALPNHKQMQYIELKIYTNIQKYTLEECQK